MHIVSKGRRYEILKPIFWEKNKKFQILPVERCTQQAKHYCISETGIGKQKQKFVYG